MRRYERSDEGWAEVADRMPGRGERGGGRWRDHRQVVNGLLWKLNTGAPWRDVPERYGPWPTIYDRFVRWRRDGTLDRVLARLRLRLDEAGRIDRELWGVDGSTIRASRAAAGGGKRGRRMSPRTTPSGAPAAASPPSSTS